MTELQKHENNTVDEAPNGVRSLVGWANELDAGFHLAQKLGQTAFTPAHFRGKPAEAASAMMYASKWGMDPISAMESVYVIHGSPALYAEAMAGIAMSAGHEIVRDSATEQAVVFKCRRRGSTVWQTVEWTISRAERAGYTRNKQYASNPIAMLTAKCQAEAAKLVAPDALMGLRTVEDVQLEEGVEAPEEPKKAAPKKRTVQRKQAPKPELPEAAEEKGKDDESESES